MQSGYSAQSTTDEVLQGVDLRGRTAMVTGASSGLGVETARSLARCGARVIMAARDENKTHVAIHAIARQVPGADLVYMPLDLSDRESIVRCAEGVQRSLTSLDLLINNAGVMACPLRRTVEGWEWQLAVNHIGHFLLTGELVPALLRAPEPRIVNLTSGGHQLGAPDPLDPHFIQRPYDKWLAYGQSKTANIWHALALFERLGDRGVSAFAVHPGAVGTDLGRHISDGEVEDLRGAAEDTPALDFKTIPQGAATSVWAATSASLNGMGGLYLEDCQIGKPVQGEGLAVSGYAAWALDVERAQAFWRQSEAWVGRRYDWPH